MSLVAAGSIELFLDFSIPKIHRRSSVVTVGMYYDVIPEKAELFTNKFYEKYGK